MPPIDRKKWRAAGVPAEWIAILGAANRVAARTPRQGTPGRGITAAAYDPATHRLTLTFTDGSTLVTPSLQGAMGEVTLDAITWATGAAGSAVTFNPATNTLTVPRGADGEVTQAAMTAAIEAGAGPFATAEDYQAGWTALLVDLQDRVLLALADDGLLFQPSGELIDLILADAEGPLAEAFEIGQPFRSRELDGGWSILEDELGRTLIKLSPDGLTMRLSAETIASIRAALGITAADPLEGVDTVYVTASIFLTQSLLFMDGADGETAPLFPAVDPATALMIGGLRRSDGIALTMAGPRSMAYDYAHQGSGFVSPDPAGAIPTGAYYGIKGYNGLRKAFGLMPRRTVGTLWGQSGEHIARYNAIVGDTEGSPVDNTNHWDNLMFWLDEMARIATAAGLTPRVDLLVTQGTSSKQDTDPLLHYRTLKALIVALRGEFDARGFEDAAIYFTQPGGDTNTAPTAEHWMVTQSFMDLAEEGYGTLVAPEAYLEIFDNNVHFGESQGIRLMGMYNWARAAHEAGRSWTIRRPIVSRSGLVVTLDYASLWDGEIWEVEADRYGGVGIDQFLGYTCDTATITAIELRGRQVLLTFDVVPLWIDYMMQHQDVTGFDDGYTAFRGRLVTTSRMRDPLDPTIVHRRRMPSHGVAVPQ